MSIRLESPLNVGALISLFTLGLFVGMFMLNYTFAQNNSNGTGTGGSGGSDSITSLIGMITAVGILLGSIGTVLSFIGNERVKKASKFLITVGQKTVENTHVMERVVRASNEISEGRLATQLDKVKMPMEKITEHAKKATEQLNYLDPNKYLPNSPEKDPNMPREAFKMPRSVDE